MSFLHHLITMNSNNSKYNYIISKSIQISSGSPAVYQLKAQKGSGNLSRLTIGEKNPNKINKTILFVGETGAGKSTLINTLFNYAIGVGWEDEVWFQIVEENKTSQTESQTPDVIMYEIFGFEDKTLPYSLTIIDTPGYGDTRGIKYDLIVKEKLLDLFRSEDGVHEIHAVGLVMKATDNRLNDRLTYIHDSMMSLFGKDLEKNIIALITHSDGRNPKPTLQLLEDLKIKCTKNEKNQPLHFLFNNCQQDKRAEDEEFLQRADLMSTNGLRKFTDFLGKTFPLKLDITVQVLNERVRLAACIQNLQDRINLTELKQTEIRQFQEALKKSEGIKSGSTVEIDEVYKDKEPIRGGWWIFGYQGAVCCKVCEETCHFPVCTITWTPALCEVMKGGRCTSCSKKCPASAHVKDKWKYVTKTRKVKASEAKLRQYKQSKTLTEEIQKLTAERSQLLDEAYEHVVILDQIALKADSIFTYIHMDFLIEKMKEKGDIKKVQKLEEMRSREDVVTKTGLNYLVRKLSVAEN